MEGILGNLFLALQQKLMSITANNQPVLRCCLEDTGQLNDQQPAMSYPGILINLDDTTFTPIGDNCRLVLANIVLKLVTLPVSATANSTPLAYKEKGLGNATIEGQIFSALQGWSPSDDALPVVPPETQPVSWPDTFGSFDSVRSVPSKLRDDLKIREITYSLGGQDYSALKRPTPHTVSINITDEIDFDL